MHSSKESIESKLKVFCDMFSKYIAEIDKFSDGIREKVVVLSGFTQTMIDDVRAFNKDYSKGFIEKKEADGQVFMRVDNFLTIFHERLMTFDVPLSNSISQEQIS